jgi:hypothetical protein
MVARFFPVPMGVAKVTAAVGKAIANYFLNLEDMKRLGH